MSIDTDVVIDEKIKQIVGEPVKYKVVLLNDDATPVDWVIDILIKVFRHSESTAKDLTLTIHNQGAGVAGVYTYEIAEQKSVEVVNASRDKGFPLQIKLEEE